MENRKHMRLPIQVSAEMKFQDGKSFQGTTMDISFGGLYIIFPEVSSLGLNARCNLHLFFQEVATKIDISFECQVTHLDDMGVGFQFIGVNGENYQNFLRLMVNNSPDPDQLLDELTKNPELELMSQSE